MVSQPASRDVLVELAQELIDAHLDTIELRLDKRLDLDDHRHLMYLQRLVREGTAVLAQLDAQPPERAELPW